MIVIHPRINRMADQNNFPITQYTRSLDKEEEKEDSEEETETTLLVISFSKCFD